MAAFYIARLMVNVHLLSRRMRVRLERAMSYRRVGPQIAEIDVSYLSTLLA